MLLRYMLPAQILACSAAALGPLDPAQWFTMPPCKGFKLEEATIDQLQAAMNAGQLMSQDLVSCYTDRIYQTQPFIK